MPDPTVAAPVAAPPFVAKPAAPGRHNADPFSGAGERLTLRSSADMVSFVYQGAQVADGRGPFSITKAQLTADGTTRNVYLVALNGTSFPWVNAEGQPTGLNTDVRSGLNGNNRYLEAVVKQIQATVPPGSNLVIAGYSLGGMVAQQVAANPAIKRDYDVLNTVTFGAPPTGNNRQEGTVHRLIDWNDPVTVLSAESPFRALSHATMRDSHEFSLTNPVKSHTSSYFQDGVWAGINALGETVKKDGPATLTFNRSDVEFFRAPVGPKSIFLSETEAPGGAIRVASPITAPGLPGASVRTAVASVLRGDESIPPAEAFGATYRAQQEVQVASLLGDRGLPTPRATVATVVDLAATLPSVSPQAGASGASVSAPGETRGPTPPARNTPSVSTPLSYAV